MNQQDYEALFSNRDDVKCKQSKWAAAFEKAHDIRKFEIDLYWKRTTYFWTLLAAIMAGYFVLLAAEDQKIPHKEIWLTLVACIGLVFSFAWHLAAKGSKFWQENWESHLDLLEDNITGPLYKIVLQTKREKSWLSSSAPYSVSKLNLWVSVFMMVIWFGLLVTPLLSNLIETISFFSLFTGHAIIVNIIFEVTIIFIGISFSALMITKARSDLARPSVETTKVKINKRRTEVEE